MKQRCGTGSVGVRVLPGRAATLGSRGVLATEQRLLLSGSSPTATVADDAIPHSAGYGEFERCATVEYYTQGEEGDGGGGGGGRLAAAAGVRVPQQGGLNIRRPPSPCLLVLLLCAGKRSKRILPDCSIHGCTRAFCAGASPSRNAGGGGGGDGWVGWGGRRGCGGNVGKRAAERRLAAACHRWPEPHTRPFALALPSFADLAAPAPPPFPPR